MAMTIDPTSKLSGLTSYEESRDRMRALNTAAASYLGMSKRDLRGMLETGKSLAELSTERGQSLDGLRQAMLAADPGSSGNGGINAMGFVDRIINMHRGHGPKGGPAIDPVPPKKGEDSAYHVLPIEMPKSSESPYHTLPVETPKSAESPYHTLRSDKTTL